MKLIKPHTWGINPSTWKYEFPATPLKNFTRSYSRMETCKATILEGTRKGNSCKFPPTENGYCNRHQRNMIYDTAKAEGKKYCRFFFRGCNTLLTEGQASCEECRKKLSKKQAACKHEGCTFKVSEGDFCKKHLRDKYYLEEVALGIKYCDIARGCFNLCKEGYKTCDSCLEKSREKDKARHENKCELFRASQMNTNSLMRVCSRCSLDYEAYVTRYNKESMICKKCSEYQNDIDKERGNRNRNYMNERVDKLENYYRDYIVSAAKRGYNLFELNYDEFSSLVKNPCHYCGSQKEGEVNGIDRVNNDIGYTKENCVSCCWTCNRMKLFYHPAFFIQKCKVINKTIESNTLFFKKWSIYYDSTKNHIFSVYKKEAEERGLSFEITETQFAILTRSPCYMCNFSKQTGVGIDRVDNTVRKYTFENCRSCCGSCNTMKGELSLADFHEQCRLISEKWPDTAFDTIPVSQNPLKKKETPDKVRKFWKADGLYYAILSNSASGFQELYKDIYTIQEFDTLCREILTYEKSKAIETLQTLLVTLKQRRYRLSKKPQIPAQD